MAAPVTLETIRFTDMLGQTDPTVTFDDVWGDEDDLTVSFQGQVVNDSCAADAPVIAANGSYMGPVFIRFSEQVSGVSLEAGCFNNARSTRVILYGENGFRVTRDVNPNSDSTYHGFSFQYGENVIRRVALVPIGEEQSGFAVDNVTVTIRPESEPQERSRDAGISSLLGANKWADDTIEWSFVTAGSDRPGYGTGPETFDGSANRVNTQAELSAGQKAMVRQALDMWDDVAGITFREVADGASPGQMRISRANIGAPADAFLPADTAQAGDVTLGRGIGRAQAQPGDYAFTAVVLHEIGHAIGLSHPHQSRGPGRALPAAEDSIELSVMSYRAGPGASTAGAFPTQAGNYPEGPMVNDIAAVQHLYGANYRTNRGDTVYRFDPAEAVIFRTIWDGGGEDTYDASAYRTGVTLHLTPGFWSTLAAGQRAILDPMGRGARDDVVARGNVANALLHEGRERSLIENATGGRGDDRIFGNQAENVLEGGPGNDLLDGLAKGDTLRGGEGRDTAMGGTGRDWIRGDQGPDVLTGGAGVDRFLYFDAADAPAGRGRSERITDFRPGQDDILLEFDADTTRRGDQDVDFIGADAFSAAGQVRAEAAGRRTRVEGDVDGDGRADFSILLDGRQTLTDDDFGL